MLKCKREKQEKGANLWSEYCRSSRSVQSAFALLLDTFPTSEEAPEDHRRWPRKEQGWNVFLGSALKPVGPSICKRRNGSQMMQRSERCSRRQEGNLNVQYCANARPHSDPCVRGPTSCGHCGSAGQGICQINRGSHEWHLHCGRSCKTAFFAVTVIEDALLPSPGLETGLCTRDQAW